MKSNLATSSIVSDDLLDRKRLARRWCVCIETVKRAEKAGKLRAVLIGPRLKRYRLADVLAIENGGTI